MALLAALSFPPRAMKIVNVSVGSVAVGRSVTRFTHCIQTKEGHWNVKVPKLGWTRKMTLKGRKSDMEKSAK